MACGNCDRIEEVIGAFDFAGKNVSYERYGSGHINDTFLIKQDADGKEVRYILQRMNHDIFKDPVFNEKRGRCNDFSSARVEENGRDAGERNF